MQFMLSMEERASSCSVSAALCSIILASTVARTAFVLSAASLPRRSYQNAANGIFVGYDVLSHHVIRGCLLYHNRQNGILRGVSDSQRLVLERNHEFENRGLPPDQTAVLAAARRKAERAALRNANVGDRQAKKGDRVQYSDQELLSSMLTTRENQKYLKRY
jgi:hypothetical protein